MAVKVVFSLALALFRKKMGKKCVIWHKHVNCTQFQVTPGHRYHH